ncbi:MAG: type IV secretory system conjugative DNA transfer family protein [Oscillospiraceae bacterium]|nr:type IV secretory system conjugative DNA transfer family protein [Oscillospiraceae bacterium]
MFIKHILMIISGLYVLGMTINSVTNGISNTFKQTELPLLEFNPFKNIFAVFSPTGFGIIGFVILMYCLFTKRGYSLISGYKTIKDKKRGLEILPEGIHGTSNWLSAKEVVASGSNSVFDAGKIGDIRTTLLGKLENKDTYVGIRERIGMNNNILVYGAPGTGKSQGFVKPFILQAAERGESVILVDPKAEFYESYSDYLRNKGYTVKVFNLLDKQNSDGFNCFRDLEADKNLVQAIAEIIINNTSNAKEKQDFWEKSEKNLLMALLHYVLTMTDEGGNLLPIEQRSIGTIYRMLATHNIAALDKKFKSLLPGHCALPPYGIFKQANPQILGNIIIGLGSRLNVFQDRFVDKITMYDDIDLELPGKEKCAYFCVISDQESSMEFLSSMFFSLLFVRLSDYARKHGANRRLPVPVNVILEEFCNIGKLLDFKKVLSTARSRGINIQIIIQSIPQLADRYPRMEWQEIVGNCDCQLFLGCNDQMTAEMISKQCGDMSVRVNNSMVPMTPLFSPVLHTTRPYTHNKTSTGRALMLPDEIRRMDFEESIALVRGQKPLKLTKIIPNEHPAFEKLSYSKITDYKPSWCGKPDIPLNAVAKQFTKDYKTDKKQIGVQLKLQHMNEQEAEMVAQTTNKTNRIASYEAKGCEKNATTGPDETRS